MRRLRPFVLLLALVAGAAALTDAAAPAPARADTAGAAQTSKTKSKAKVKAKKSVKFGKPTPLAAGTIIDETSRMTIDMTIVMGSQTIPLSMSNDKPHAIELLEVSDGVPRKIRVVWGAATENQPMGQPEPTVLAGKTYLIDFGASGMKVTRPDGNAVTGDELTAVQKEHGDFGRGDKLRKVLVGKTFKVGKKVKLRPAQFADVFGEPDEMTVSSFAIRLDAVGTADATFTYWVKMASTDPARAMSIDGQGTFVVDIARVLPLTFTLDGPLTGDFDQGGQKLKVTGTMSARGTKTYR